MPSPLRTAPTAVTLAHTALVPPADPSPPGTLQLLRRWSPEPASAGLAQAASAASPAPAWAHWLRRHIALR